MRRIWQSLQNNNKTNTPTFTFFKSVQTLWHDFEKLKTNLKTNQKHKHPILDKIRGKELTNSSKKTLDQFADQYAVSYWSEHSSIYKKLANRQKLLNSIKDTELYKNPKIQSQLKLK